MQAKSMEFVTAPPAPGRRHGVRRAGFTLIELLVVLAILGLLVGLVGPRVIGALGKAKTGTARTQIKELGSSVELYYIDVGRYPTSSQGLQALVQDPGDVANWNGPYLKKTEVPTDPWGFAYEYRAPGEHGDFDIWSLGADNREGGEGDDQDVHSWD